MDVQSAGLRQCGSTTKCTKDRWFRTLAAKLIFNQKLKFTYLSANSIKIH